MDLETLVKKITPYKDRSWYIKWCASFILLGAIAIRSAGICYELDIILSCIGTAMWGYVGFVWHDRALIVVNSVACVMLIVALLKIFLS